jgi:ribosomal-protein-alanine N-acetyltransferase
VKVRLAEHADGATLAEIHAEAFEAPWPEADLRRFATDPGGFALLAEDEGHTSGFKLCRVIAGEAEVLTLAVRPARRRRGAARALVGAAIGFSAQTAGSMFLEVAADNPGAIALYEAAGFVRVGRRRGYYARPGAPAVDAIVMRQALNS